MFPEIVHVTSKQSRTLLTWTHYRELLRVEDPKVRAWYEREAADQSWNVGVLSRNISSQYCERMLSNHVEPPHGKAIVPSAAAKCQSYALRISSIHRNILHLFAVYVRGPCQMTLPFHLPRCH